MLFIHYSGQETIISVLAITLICLGASQGFAQHKLEVDDGAGHFSTIVGGNPGGAFTLPSSAGTLITNVGLSSLACLTIGNVGTTPAANPLTFNINTNSFIGTGDNKELDFVTNGQVRARFKESTGDTATSGAFEPGIGVTYSLGTLDRPWKELFVSNGTITFTSSTGAHNPGHGIAQTFAVATGSLSFDPNSATFQFDHPLNVTGGTGVTTPSATITNLASLTGGMVKADTGGTLFIATAGADYSAGTKLLATGILRNTTGTGALTIAVPADFPTLNQNTTGSAAKLTTPRTIGGNSFDGSANTTFANKFIVQGTTDAGLTNAQFLGALGTGIVLNTTATGVLSIAVPSDFPTLNQNTTGSAAKLTTARTIGGNSFDGSANIPLANKFIVQGTTDGGLTNAQFLGALATGIVKNTTTTGALTIAIASDFPTLNQNTTGSAATLTTARTIGGNSFDGSANIPLANKFIVQGTTDGGLTNAQFLGALATGIVKNTTTTGALTIAVPADFPTLNQNTTGSAATLTTARTIGGNSFDGSANIPLANKFIVQGTTDGGLTNAQFLGALTTGLVKVTNSTGVLTTAVAGTDYQAPIAAGDGIAIASNTISLGGTFANAVTINANSKNLYLTNPADVGIGTSGPTTGLFEVTSATKTAVRGVETGVANSGGEFIVNNAANPNHALIGNTNGTGNAVDGTATGAGWAGHFDGSTNGNGIYAKGKVGKTGLQVNAGDVILSHTTQPTGAFAVGAGSSAVVTVVTGAAANFNVSLNTGTVGQVIYLYNGDATWTANLVAGTSAVILGNAGPVAVPPGNTVILMFVNNGVVNGWVTK